MPTLFWIGFYADILKSALVSWWYRWDPVSVFSTHFYCQNAEAILGIEPTRLLDARKAKKPCKCNHIMMELSETEH
jgi:hypothetical protein